MKYAAWSSAKLYATHCECLKNSEKGEMMWVGIVMENL